MTTPAFHELATALAEGRLDAALARLATAEAPPTELASKLGAELAKAGRRAEAIEVFRRCVAAEPNLPKHALNLATALAGDGRLEAALAAVEAGLAQSPDHARLHERRGRIATKLGRLRDARAAFERAVELEPTRENRKLLARLHLDLGEADAARTLLADVERDPEAERLLALATLGSKGTTAAELERLVGELSATATDPLELVTLASAALSGKHFEAALTLAERTPPEAAPPVRTEAREVRARAAKALGRPELAVTALEEIGLADLSDGALATWLELVKRRPPPEHLAALERALVARPDDPQVLLERAKSPLVAVSEAAAFAELERLLEAHPHFLGARARWFELTSGACDWEIADTVLRATNEDAGLPTATSWSALHDGHQSLASLRVDLRAVAAAAPQVHLQATPVDRTWPRRLRVGFVSGDLRAHAVEFFMRGLFRDYDRSRFEFFTFSTKELEDDRTRWIAERTVYRNVATLSRAEQAHAVAEARIDVLIDLAGLTADSGLELFRFRPAPLQGSYVGFPSTVGVPELDFRITDGVADPEPLTDALHTERLVRLDRCGWNWADCDPTPRTPRPEGAPIVFGSFNRAEKLSEALLTAWAELLRRVPESRLYLKGKGLFGRARQRVQARLEAAGAPTNRVLLVGWTTRYADHLASWNDVDVMLDSYPYTGTTTTTEALSRGMPVVTLAGPAHVSRVGASLLEAVGLSHLVARNWSEYVAIAARLAADPAERRAIEERLLRDFGKTSLGDAAAFSRSFERALVSLWEDFLASPELDAFGRATRVENRPTTYVLDPGAPEAASTVTRDHRFDPQLCAFRSLAGPRLSSDVPGRVAALQALGGSRQLNVAIADADEAPLRASLPGASLVRALPTDATDAAFGSRALMERARSLGASLFLLPPGHDPAEAEWVEVFAWPELDLLERGSREGHHARLFLTPERAESLARDGVLLDPGDVSEGRAEPPRLEGPAPESLVERAHLAAFGLEGAALPPAAEAFSRALDPAVPAPIRASLALAALDRASRDFDKRPSWPRALTGARIALSTGRFHQAARLLGFVLDLEAIEPPTEAFVPALPRYLDACLAGPRPPMARPLPSRWSVLGDDPCAPPTLAEGRRRAELHPLLAVDPIARWVIQQACEALLLFTPVGDRSDALLQRFFGSGGRSLTLSLWRGITRRR
jgi:predicted O-linked N-acetylglucosamine transferase (SPINDLY family)